jgi:GT2 family glycosyltransferase
MRASIIIPVWNGADVLAGCLDSIREQADDHLLEVICVDNDSQDASAALLADRYPEVRLLRQRVNLGFAGGVNAGLAAARGDLLILLNQDCIVQPGWLAALSQAMEAAPDLGVAGCTLSRPDGDLDHVGAEIRRPEGYGQHLAQVGAGELVEADFVSGAAMAISRRAMEAIGPFDEGFYPGYYEDADYCYRARRRGFTVACVARARVVHLAHSAAWQQDTVRYQADHCLARYRFVAKHFDGREKAAFFAAEGRAIEEEEYLDRAIGRALAARDLLRGIPDLLQRRHLDLDVPALPADRRQLQVGFARLRHQGQAAAGRLALVGLVPPPLEAWQEEVNHLRDTLAELLPSAPAGVAGAQAVHEAELRRLEERETEILRRLYPLGFSPGGQGTRLKQVGYRLRRLWQALTGLDEVLHGELQAVRAARREWMHRRERAYAARMQLLETLTRQNEQLCRYHQERLERRLKLLEALIDYDHR